jgi:hypothetical protein
VVVEPDPVVVGSMFFSRIVIVFESARILKHFAVNAYVIFFEFGWANPMVALQ